MKKTLICLVTIFSVVFLMGRELTYEYKLEAPEISRSESGFTIINQTGGMSRSEIGYPALPWQSLKILLPPGEIAESLEINFTDEEEMILDSYVYPSQPVLPVSSVDSTKFKLNRFAYQSQRGLPANQTGKLKTESWHGYNILLSSYCPFSYLPLENKLIHYKTASVTIKTQAGTLNPSGRMIRNYSPIQQQKTAAFVQNPQDVNWYPQDVLREIDYELLVVCDEQFLATLQEMESYYNQFGIRVEYRTTYEINLEYPGIDLAEKIRNLIIEEYTNSGIISVLLAGDTEQIPARGFWCQVQSSELYEDANIPSDLYYSALDGSWNDDSDALWGEPEEDDLLPEIAVARLPFSDETELANMLNKSLLYAQSPVESDLNKPLLIGELLWYDPLTWGSDYLDLLVGWHDDNGYTTNGIYETDNIIYLNDRDYSAWTIEEFFSTINEGVSFIHHSGHSSYDYMVRMETEEVLMENFPDVNGLTHQTPILYTHGCNCGGFDQDDCIAEEALKIPGFLAGFVGNSRYGWFNEGQTEGPSQHLHREFVNALYSEEINQIASTHLQSKLATAVWVTAPGQHEEGALRWCFYECNVLADPTLPVWTAQPVGITVNYPVQINANTSSMTIYVEKMHTNEPAEGYRTALIYDDQVISTTHTDSLGISTPMIDTLLTHPGSDLTLIVSGYNCLPQSYYVNISGTGSDEDQILPSTSKLMNYPNPFNPETEISFHLTNPERVSLAIYTIKGQHVVTLMDKGLAAGDHSLKWNGKDKNNKLVNSGIYLAKLLTENSSQEIKMLLLK